MVATITPTITNSIFLFFSVNTFKTGIVLDIFKLALFFFSFLCTLASFYSRDEP
jgi:hypothetical protein